MPALYLSLLSVGTSLFNKNMTHLTGREMADPRQQQQREGRMYNHCWHVQCTLTATVRQVQLSQIAVADNVTNASAHTA